MACRCCEQHIDTSVVRLLDGTKAYLHAVIDNYSRRILSWKVSPAFNPVATAEILLDASKGMVDCKPMLLADGGVENFNGAVHELVESGLLNRVLAQTEITFSNSLIESWFSSWYFGGKALSRPETKMFINAGIQEIFRLVLDSLNEVIS